MKISSSLQEAALPQLPTIEEFAGIFTMDTASETVVTTFCNMEVNLLSPVPSSIRILDIAHHESLINRYNGAVEHSVAYHSYLASLLVPDSAALAVLLHDAAEAYVGDDVKQKKNIVMGSRELEDRLQRTICEKYGLDWPQPSIVKRADLAIYALELVKLLGWTHKVRELPAIVRHATIKPRPWEDVRHLFLARFYELYYGTRAIRFEDGALFFSGNAKDAFTALTRYFGIKTCCGAMESGVIPHNETIRPFLKKAA